MAQNIRLVEYFYVHVPNKAGAASEVLDTLRNEGIDLLAVSGFPDGRRSQLDFVPADSSAFRVVARRNKWKLTGPKRAFLIMGDDNHPGIVADLTDRLAEAKINVTAATVLCANSRNYAGILWVAPESVRRATAVLGAKPLAPAPSRYAPEPEQPQAT